MLNLSKMLNKAVVVNFIGLKSRIVSIYANNNAKKDETKSKIYVKHTMTDTSAFESDEYAKNIKNYFPIIKYKKYNIGLTICYDCNHAAFSRMYGLQDVDVILNSTGGDVKYKKWYIYNKTRAIENNCYNFVTMGGEKREKNSTYGFNRNGGLLLPENLESNKKRPSTHGKVYIY